MRRRVLVVRLVERFGEPDAMRVVTDRVPEPQPGEVRMRVRAASGDIALTP